MDSKIFFEGIKRLIESSCDFFIKKENGAYTIAVKSEDAVNIQAGNIKTELELDQTLETIRKLNEKKDLHNNR